MRKLVSVLTISLGTLLGGCTPSQSEQTNTPHVRYDTINFGSYYGTSQDSTFFLSFKDKKGRELSEFRADSSYQVTVTFKGQQEIPFRLVSLNRNAAVKLIDKTRNQYQLHISQQVPTTDKYYARFAVVPPDSMTKYVFRNRFWVDSARTNYQEATLQADTICKLAFKINDLSAK